MERKRCQAGEQADGNFVTSVHLVMNSNEAPPQTEVIIVRNLDLRRREGVRCTPFLGRREQAGRGQFLSRTVRVPFALPCFPWVWQKPELTPISRCFARCVGASTLGAPTAGGHFQRRLLSCRLGEGEGTNLLGCGSSCALLDLQLRHPDAGRRSRRALVRLAGWP